MADPNLELLTQVAEALGDLREYVADVFANLLANEGFLNALPGLLIEGSPANRSPVVLQRLRAIAQMKGGS